MHRANLSTSRRRSPDNLGRASPICGLSGADNASPRDLLDGRFVLLVGPAGASCWQNAACAAAASLGIALSAYVVGADGDLVDLEHGWRTKMGVPDDGVVLVRPDGFVGWRTNVPSREPEPLLVQVLASILCRSATVHPAEARLKH